MKSVTVQSFIIPFDAARKATGKIAVATNHDVLHINGKGEVTIYAAKSGGPKQHLCTYGVSDDLDVMPLLGHDGRTSCGLPPTHPFVLAGAAAVREYVERGAKKAA